jgi:tyrosyl-tRNA synthetase
MKKHLVSPYLKLAQKTLAKEVTIIMRGQEELDNALKSSDILFSKTSKDLINDTNLSKLVNDIPNTKSKCINILDALIETSLAISKREAKEFVNNNAIYVNGELVNDLNYEIKSTPKNKAYALIKCGKRKNSLIIFK